MEVLLAVAGPDLVPLHHDDRSRRSLGNDEVLQTLHCHPSSQNASDSREPRVIPVGQQLTHFHSILFRIQILNFYGILKIPRNPAFT